MFLNKKILSYTAKAVDETTGVPTDSALIDLSFEKFLGVQNVSGGVISSLYILGSTSKDDDTFGSININASEGQSSEGLILTGVSDTDCFCFDHDSFDGVKFLKIALPHGTTDKTINITMGVR